MGLFSFLSKNKQDRTAEDSGRFMTRAEDDAQGQRARSKRASNAGEGARRGRGADPALPEKKRARRRLVGSIALALAAAVVLPMLLDSGPKPLAGDIAIDIPAKDKAPPLPAPLDPAAKADAVPVADSVDKGEEIVEPPKQAPVHGAGEASTSADAKRAFDARQIAEARTAPAKPETATPELAKPDPVRSEHARPELARQEPFKPEHKAPIRTEPKPEPKPESKPEHKPEHKSLDKPVQKPAAKLEEKHTSTNDSARALAILEGKAAEKASEAAQDKIVLQVAALATADKAAELQAKLSAAGIHSFTEKLSRPGGDLIRVKVGPLSRDEAEKVRAKLGKLGL